MLKWPQNFNFETDLICQNRIKPFIENQLEALKAYDAERRALEPRIRYIFYEHTERVAEDVRKTCLHLGLGDVVAQNMYWAVLPHDIGKMAFPPKIWFSETKPTETVKTQRREHILRGPEMVTDALGDLEHPFMDLMLDIMKHHHEQMDGRGPLGISGDQLSAPVRLTSIVEAFDGWSIPRPHFDGRDVSPAAVIERMRSEKLHMFDETLFEAFADMKLAET